MEMIFIAIFILVYALLAWRRLDLALMALLFLLPAYQVRFSVFDMPSTVLEVMILVSFGVWLAKNRNFLFENFKNRLKKLGNWEIGKLNRNRRYPFDWEIVFILVISWLAIAVAGLTDSAFGIWKAYFFEPVLVFIMLVNAFGPRSDRPAQYHKVIWPLMLSALALSLWAVAQKLGVLSSPENFWPRVTGPFPYPNALGLLLGPVLVLGLGYGMGKILNTQYSILNKYSIFNIKYPILLISIFFSFVALFLARSEGAVIGVMAALVVMGLVYAGMKWQSRKILWAGRILVYAILVFIIVSPWFFLRVVPEHKYFNFERESLNFISDKILLKDFSGEVRKQQWRETWAFLISSPRHFLLGAGLSGYQAAIGPYHQDGIFFNHDRDEDFRRKVVLFDERYKAAHWRPVEIYMYPHSFFLNFWVELGLLGVLLFVWMMIKLAAISFKLLENSR